MERTKLAVLTELLVIQAQAGDANAIGRLSSLWQPEFLAYAARLLDDHEEAHDVVQESWLSMIRGIRKLNDPAAFPAWSFRIVRNKSIDQIRRKVRERKRRVQALLTASVITNKSRHGRSSLHQFKEERIKEERLKEERLKEVNDAMEVLQPEDRALLKLFYHNELSLKEISFVNGTSVSAVKSKLFQLRKQIRQKLKEKFEGTYDE